MRKRRRGSHRELTTTDVVVLVLLAFCMVMGRLSTPVQLPELPRPASVIPGE